MNSEPFSFTHALADFDLSKLPVDPALLRSDAGILAASIQAYYEELFKKMGGTAAVAIKDGVASISWYPSSGNSSKMISERALQLLQQGDYRSAEPLLRMLIARDPENPELLYNLGMMLSDQGKLAEAILLLEQLVEIEPESSYGWTALGVAYSRGRQNDKAERALKQALKIDPENAYALRNLGGIQQEASPDQALEGLEKAAHMMPSDQRAQYGYALCLLKLDRSDDADPILKKVIDLDPLTEIAELARDARRKIAHETLRADAGGGLRMDAVFYCVGGMKKFREMGAAKMQAVVYEISLLGRGGLDINDPAQKYTLKSLPGQFSGLHLVSLMYTGLKQIDPSLDGGIDLSKEYEAALNLDKMNGSK
jgi:tetratricopeptide (TPR) repeat protein